MSEAQAAARYASVINHLHPPHGRGWDRQVISRGRHQALGVQSHAPRVRIWGCSALELCYPIRQLYCQRHGRSSNGVVATDSCALRLWCQATTGRSVENWNRLGVEALLSYESKRKHCSTKRGGRIETGSKLSDLVLAFCRRLFGCGGTLDRFMLKFNTQTRIAGMRTRD